MRIVSQCGQADFPYERTYILSDRENVKAVCDGKSYVIGRYSTHEKAIKAMEMCRKQYMDGIGVVLMGVLHSGYIRVMMDRR